MKARKKIFIVILLIIFAIFIGVKLKNGKTSVVDDSEKKADTQKPKEEFVEVLEDGTRVNTSKTLSKERDLNGLKITNIQLVNSEGTTMLIADVENTTSSSTKLQPVAVKILDKEGKVLTTLKGLIAPLEPGQTTQMNIGITSDYANAYDFEIEEVNE